MSKVKRRTKVLTAIAVTVPVAVGSAATAYGVHYRDRALRGSSVAGIDVAGMTRDQVAAALRAKADAVTIALTLPDNTRQVTLADLGTTVDVDATVARVFAANEDWRPYAEALVKTRPVDVVTTADARTYDAFVAGLGASYERKPANAVVALAKDGYTFTATKGSPGRVLEVDGLDGIALTAARTLTSGTARTTVVEQEPAVSTADGKELAAKANAIARADVSVTDAGRIFEPTTRQKASWVKLPATGTTGEVTVDATRVTAWITEQAKSVDTAPSAGLRYLNSAGKLVRVITPAKDGRTVTNAAAVAKALTASLNAAEDTSETFTTKAIPATWTQKTIAAGAENLAYPAVPGEKWIDVNLSRHTMTAYVGATAVLGPIAMVNGAPATPTDIGVFHIYLKNPMMTMRGQNADGTDYETPDVPWSSFFNGGEALHGAYWRKTWGYAASHGCVNLPIPTAKWIYDWAPIGTTVVTHN